MSAARFDIDDGASAQLPDDVNSFRLFTACPTCGEDVDLMNTISGPHARTSCEEMTTWCVNGHEHTYSFTVYGSEARPDE